MTTNVSMQKLKNLKIECHLLFDSLGPSREMSLAKTKIDEAIMWAREHVNP